MTCLLSIVYCLLPIAYCLLSIVYCLLSTVYFLYISPIQKLTMRYQEVFKEFEMTVGRETPIVMEGSQEFPARRVLCICDSPEMHMCKSKMEFRLWQMDSLQDGIEVLRRGFNFLGRNVEMAREAIDQVVRQGVGRTRPVYFCTYLEKV